MKSTSRNENQKRRISRSLIYEILRDHEAGHPVEELCEKHAIKTSQLYYWRDLYKPEHFNVKMKLERLEKELKQYEVALLLQAEQIRVLNEIVHNKFKD